MILKLKLQYLGHLMQRVDSLERLWCWEGWGTGGKGDDRGWDGWMASPTSWTWVWVNSGRWWWTGRPGVLRFMGSQRVGHDWATEMKCIKMNFHKICKLNLKFTKSMMISNHLIFHQPLLLLPSIFPASGSFLMNWLFTYIFLYNSSFLKEILLKSIWEIGETNFFKKAVNKQIVMVYEGFETDS